MIVTLGYLRENPLEIAEKMVSDFGWDESDAILWVNTAAYFQEDYDFEYITSCPFITTTNDKHLVRIMEFREFKQDDNTVTKEEV